jgi:hypothetical protein
MVSRATSLRQHDGDKHSPVKSNTDSAGVPHYANGRLRRTMRYSPFRHALGRYLCPIGIQNACRVIIEPWSQDTTRIEGV